MAGIPGELWVARVGALVELTEQLPERRRRMLQDWVFLCCSAENDVRFSENDVRFSENDVRFSENDVRFRPLFRKADVVRTGR